MIEFVNNKACIIPQAKVFFKKVKKADLDELVTYLYYYYDEDSHLAELLPDERKDLCIEMLKDTKIVEVYKDIIDEYEYIILSPEQRLAQAHLKKIEEIIRVFNDTPITIENLDAMTKNMKSVNEMYSLSEKVKEIIAKSKSGTGKGNKKINAYEQLTFDQV